VNLREKKASVASLRAKKQRQAESVDAESVKRRGVVVRMKHVASDDTAASLLADSGFACDSNTSLAKHPGNLCRPVLLLNAFNKCAE